MKSVIVGLVAVAGIAGAAFGQAGFNVGVEYGPSGSVNPGNPSAIVRISARFSPNDYAFAGGRFDVGASDGTWSGNTLVGPIAGSPGVNPGVLGGSNVTGVICGQVHFPPVLPGNNSNPILLWEATWTTNDFTARSVAVTTTTARFDVYPSSTSPSSQSRLSGLVEGAGDIVVTPAPSALALLGLGGLVAGRRRR
jgi:hypothetical protein